MSNCSLNTECRCETLVSAIRDAVQAGDIHPLVSASGDLVSSAEIIQEFDEEDNAYWVKVDRDIWDQFTFLVSIFPEGDQP